MEFTYIYFYLIPIFVIIIANAQKRRRDRMKPRVSVEPSTFLDIVKKSDAKIIKTGKLFLQGYMYVVEADDYYYVTISKEELNLPEGREVVHSKLVQF